MSQKILTLFFFLAAVKHGTAVLCYYCYDLYNGTKIPIADSSLHDKFVKCDERQKFWNSWECPPEWPVCTIMSLTSKVNHQVVRTCAIKDFCNLYVPQDGVKVESCRECVTPLCNDHVGFPPPAENEGPLFVFNINLYVNKYSLKDHENHWEE